MIEQVEGIILKTTDYKESSLILNVLTPKYGLIGIIAKGCKKLKSPLRTCSLMTYGYFSIVYKEGKLSNLTSIDIIDNLKNIKKDITKISYASYLLDLTNQVVRQNSDSNIYELLKNGLIKINEGFDSLIITNIIELKYLEYLGVLPNLDSCYKCGSKEVITISNGGYVCKDCITNEKIVNSKIIKLLRMFYYVDLSKITNTDIKEDIKFEINNFISGYYEFYTGLYIKSKNFITNLNKI